MVLGPWDVAVVGVTLAAIVVLALAKRLLKRFLINLL